MGRRAYSPDKRRRNSCQAYLSDLEYARVYRVAIKQDMHLSAFFRFLLLREVERTEKKEGKT